MFDGTKKELQKGDNLVLGPLVGGHKMTSNRPIQVDLVAGDIGSKYELRGLLRLILALGPKSILHLLPRLREPLAFGSTIQIWRVTTSILMEATSRPLEASLSHIY